MLSSFIIVMQAPDPPRITTRLSSLEAHRSSMSPVSPASTQGQRRKQRKAERKARKHPTLRPLPEADTRQNPEYDKDPKQWTVFDVKMWLNAQRLHEYTGVSYFLCQSC